MTFIKQIEKINPFILLIGLWIFVQIITCIYCGGANVVFDSHRYIANAKHIGEADIMYISYALLFAPVVNLDVGVNLFVGFQVLLSGLAVVLMYRAVFSITDSKLTGLVAAVLMLWPELQMWNYYIHTESVFISLSVIAFYFYAQKQFIWLWIFLLILTFMRPNGIFVPASFALFFTYYRFKDYNKKTLLIGFGLFFLSGVVAFELVMDTLSNLFRFEGHFIKGFVVQGYKGLIYPKDISYCKDCESHTLKLFSILWENPLHCIRLLGLRLVFLMTQYRPYYTNTHNVIEFLFFLPQFLIIGYAFKRILKHKVTLLLCIAIALQIIVVMISAVDWDNRFMSLILPFMFVLTALSVKEVIFNFSKRTS